MNQPITFWS